MGMTKSKKKKQSPQQRPAMTDGRRWRLIAVTIVVAIGIVSAVALVQGERGEFKTLNGRWLRLDGGYILEIRAVDPRGKIDALYLNPRADQHRQGRSHARWLEAQCFRRATRA